MSLGSLSILMSGNVRRWAAVAALSAACVALVPNDYYRTVLFTIFLFAGMASAWNIAAFGGQVSFGHAAFFGGGAYTGTLLFLRLGISPWLGMFAGGVIAAALGYAIGLPCLRLRGIFLGLATLALSEAARIMVATWEFTGAYRGLYVPFKPGFENMIFDSKSGYLLLSAGYFLAVTLISALVYDSRFGLHLRGIRADEEAAEHLGVPTFRRKLAAFVLSAFLTGLAGTIYAQYLLFIDTETVFSWGINVQFFLYGVLGGLGTVWGPTVGAVILIPLLEIVRENVSVLSQQAYVLVYGAILTLTIMLLPRGVLSALQRLTAAAPRRSTPLGRNQVAYVAKAERAEQQTEVPS